jgi:hypothetical protein
MMPLPGVIMKKIRCIARSYGDRPLERFALGQERDLIYVSNPSLVEDDQILALRAVGFPRKFGFSYESELLTHLAKAREEGDSERLERLWNKAKTFAADLPVMESLISQPQIGGAP